MRTVEMILPAAESFLPGDFVVYRALPRRELRRVGGFVFLDHFDHENVTPEMFDVPPHPHIGLQTVTYLFEGEVLHTDSLDNQETISPGAVNWMTAGRGITHAEQVATPQSRMHGLQSWVGLPHGQRKVEPAFDHFTSDSLPVMDLGGCSVKVLAGKCGDIVSPIPTYQELTYLDVTAADGGNAEFAVEAGHELAVYVCEGSITVDGQTIGRHDQALLTAGDAFRFESVGGARFVIFGGETLPEPTVIYWNFITDTVGEAKQAALDWEDGKFPPVTKYRKFTTTP
ncbi:MAG: pirin family protein [Pyrinomonadaceae bacterium]|nr:pirin family protein [Pyrinomonadaceae bacterium]